MLSSPHRVMHRLAQDYGPVMRVVLEYLLIFVGTLIVCKQWFLSLNEGDVGGPGMDRIVRLRCGKKTLLYFLFFNLVLPRENF